MDLVLEYVSENTTSVIVVSILGMLLLALYIAIMEEINNKGGDK
jgi:hypothetical protein